MNTIFIQTPELMPQEKDTLSRKGKNMKKFDVVALGEILIDMTFAGKSESGQTLFEQNPGGAPANVLSAVKRLGGEVAFIGKVGDDMHGNFLLETLEKEDICTDGVVVDDSVFTTLAFVNIDEKGDRSFSFARKPGADTCLSFDEVKKELIENTKIFHVGSLSLTDEPVKSATFKALDMAKSLGKIISYDPNWRAPLWKSEEEGKKGMRMLIPYVDIIKISDEETKLLTDFESPEDASAALINQGVKIVIVTMGEKGALVRTKDGFVTCNAQNTKAVDTTGAGDAFMGSFLWNVAKCGKSEISLLQAEEFAAFSNKVAAWCVGRRGAIKAMPYLSEIE